MIKSIYQIIIFLKNNKILIAKNKYRKEIENVKPHLLQRNLYEYLQKKNYI